MPIRETPLAPKRGRVRRPVGVALIAVFALMIAAPAVSQIVFELGGWFDRTDPETGEVTRDRNVQMLDVFADLDRLSVFQEAGGGADAQEPWTLLRHIEDFESDLEQRSALSGLAQPWTQWAQLGLARHGNEKVIAGRDKWLFHRPSVSHITTSNFLEERGARPNEDEQRSDPLATILRFKEQLDEKGIDLIVAPVPVKGSIYPEKLIGQYDASKGPPVNAGLDAFYRRLRAEGVIVLDVRDALWAARDEKTLWLRNDSHWTPAGMRIYARELAELLIERYDFVDPFPYEQAPDYPARRYHMKTQRVTNHGDLYEMLKLPALADHFPATTLDIEQVRSQGTRDPVASDPERRIVLIGDSAANIYSMNENMGWGAHAGLPEYLIYYIKQPIHWIAINGGGPSLTRQRLARAGIERKRVVVWEFLMRDLTHPIQPWEHVPMPSRPSAAATGPLQVEATIAETSEPPVPGAGEIYPNTVAYTLVRVDEVVEGEYKNEELLIVEWVQKDRDFDFPPQNYQAGDKLDLKLIPLEQAEKANPAIRNSQFVDDVQRYDLPAYWVDEHVDE